MAESVRCHLNFDPNSAPGVARVYDSVQSSGPMVVTSLTEELKNLAKRVVLGSNHMLGDSGETGKCVIWFFSCSG